MAHQLEDVDLSHNSRNVSLILDLLLLENLDGDLLLRQLVDALPHLSEGARADGLAHQVVADQPVVNLIVVLLVALCALTTVTLLGRHLFVLGECCLE